MREFSIKVKLLYEYLDGSGFSRHINYKYDIYSFKEPMHGSIIEVHPNFVIQIKELICENHDQALLAASSILEHICRAISISIQLQNYDNRECQPNVSFRKSDIEIVGERSLEQQIRITQNENGDRVINVKEEISFRDGIHSMQITQDLDLDFVDILLRLYHKNDAKQFYVDTIFRALRSRDIESKYFTLFTIIERLETAFAKDENISQILFDEGQQEMFLSFIKPQISEVLGQDSLFVKRVYDRVTQIIKSATVKTRTEKLCYILNECYRITKISKGLLQFDLDSKKVKEFIDQRNKLFHGKQVEETVYNKMVQLTNELLEICLEVLRFEDK